METTAQQPAHSVLQRLAKSATAIVMMALLCAAVWFLFDTPAGARLRADPRAFGNNVRASIVHHPLAAPLALLSVYTLFAVLALPIWWLQILAGVGLGLYEGTFVCLIGSTLGTAIAFALSRWIAADYFHRRIESKMQQLRQLDETLGHNGLLFVMTVRLIPLLPFGLFNYAMGLTNVSFLDAVLGTFLGALPVVAVHVGVGAGYYPWKNWKYDLALTSITLVLLLPVMLRYLRPQWFKKIGVE